MEEIDRLISKVEEAMLATNRSLSTLEGRCGLHVNDASSKLVDAMVLLEKAKECLNE